MTATSDLKVLGPEYIEECAGVMAEAFSDSPVYRFIFRGTLDFRKVALEWVFVRNIRLVLAKCPTALRGILNESNEVICCFMWVPHEYQNVSLGEMIWHGLLKMPIRFGLDSVKRMLQAMEDVEGPSQQHNSQQNENGHDKVNKKGSIQLQRMVVRPDCQGQGLGTKALKAVMAEESAKGNVNLHLDTQLPRNVAFYERLGYKVIWEKDCYEEDEEYKFHSWFMVRADESS